ncbi:MAG: hypothetical protein R3F11_25865 [Verrucomicrobiales bacterium]
MDGVARRGGGHRRRWLDRCGISPPRGREVAWFRGGDQPQWTKNDRRENLLSGAAAVGAVADLTGTAISTSMQHGESKNRLVVPERERRTRWRTLRIADRQAATAIAATDLDEDGAPDLIVSRRSPRT